MEESISRYREILRKERELYNEGKTLHIPKVFEEFMDKEIKLRRERYDIPEPVVAKTVEQEPAREVSVLPSDSISKPIVEPDTRSSVQQAVPPAASVKETQSPPANTTFSATLSQVASYMGGPQRAPAATSPSPPAPTSPPPAPPAPESQASRPPVATDTTVGPPVEVYSVKPFKEHPIPPIPKSDALVVILSSIPEPVSPDPILATLLERLNAVKELTWVDHEQHEFDSREDKIAKDHLAASQARQEVHSVRQSSLYAENSWEQATAESETFDELEQRYKETEIKHSIARWRSEYCDPTYTKLHSIFGDITALHKDVVETECENTEEQVELLNQVQQTLMEVLAKLDVVTDELRRKQHSLKVHRAHVTGDWEMVQVLDKEKEEEDHLLREQRGEYRLGKVTLHVQCVKYLVDYMVENITERKKQIEDQIKRTLEEFPESSKSEKPPHEGSMDTYPSEALLEQLQEAQRILTRMCQRVNTLYTLLEQNELRVIAEESTPALNTAQSASDWDTVETLKAEQNVKETHLLDENLKTREVRNAENTALSDQISSYIAAHNGRKQARLEAIALSAGGGEGGNGEGNATTKLKEDQMKPQMVSNMLNTMHMSRMGVINK